MNRCKKCNYDNSLHKEDKCQYCGEKIAPSNICDGFYMDIIPHSLLEILDDVSGQAYLEGNKIVIKTCDIPYNNSGRFLQYMRDSYDDFISEKKCDNCGSLFCDNDNCGDNNETEI